MKVLDRLRTFKNSTESERALISYILENPETFIQKSTAEISRDSFVSVSTIYRLCDKLGCSGLASLKLNIAAELHPDAGTDHGDFDFGFPFQQEDDMEAVLESLQVDYRRTLAMTAEILDGQELVRAALAMKEARQIDVYASAGNIHFAQNFQFQMMEIGCPVHVFSDEYSQRLQASISDAGHLAIMISFGGRGLLFYWLLDILQHNQTPIVLVGADENPMLGLAPYNLQLCATENHHRKISSFSTRLSLLYILDALYSAYFQLDFSANLARKEQYYRPLSGRMEGPQESASKENGEEMK